MKYLFVIFWLCVLAAPSSAETITIKSGEHGTFTRLVLYLPDKSGWQLEQDKRKVSIVFPGKRYEAVLDQVFLKITRERIGEVNVLPAKGRIELLLNCDCVATAFEYRPRIMVVDVAPEGPSSTEVKPVNRGFLNDFWIDTILKHEVASEATPVETSSERDVVEVGDSAFSGIVDAIMQKASQGYLTASAGTYSENTRSAQIVPHLSTGPHGSEADGASFSVAPHIIKTNNEERFDCGAQLRPMLESNGFGTEIASLQSKLIGDDGEVSHDVAEQMARSYIYFGLPQEARQILKLADATVREKYTPTLRFLDVDSWAGGLPPKTTVGCEALAELAFVVISGGQPEALVSPEGFLKQFKSLSPHLRELIGPRLSAALRVNARNNIAEKLDEFLSKAQPKPESLAEVLKTNNYETVSLEIEAAAADSTRFQDYGPEASIPQEVQEDGGYEEAIDPSLMETFLKEYDGSLPDETLAKLLVSLRTDEGKFKSAVAEIRNSEILSVSDKEALLSRVVSNATTTGSTRNFLEMAFFLHEQEIARLSESRRSEIRARLLELGFDEKAEALVPQASLPADQTGFLERDVL
ncbi:hypothetical protein [Primorskyibacter flagellatus]|uniref:hypothetical protein n=1 Tax=Primorskyibacter flagellatus TaxID=1387277 RepID=UPI003A8DFEA1